MARRVPTTPQEIGAQIEEEKLKGTNSRGSPSGEEEPEDLSKVIIPYASPKDADTSCKVVEVRTSSKDVPTGVKVRDDLLRWVCESFAGAYIQISEEDE